MSPGLITCVLELTIFSPVITKDAQIGLVTFWLGQVKSAENTSIEPLSTFVKAGLIFLYACTCTCHLSFQNSKPTFYVNILKTLISILIYLLC
jgi:hypothetical protein